VLEPSVQLGMGPLEAVRAALSTPREQSYLRTVLPGAPFGPSDVASASFSAGQGGSSSSPGDLEGPRVLVLVPVVRGTQGERYHPLHDCLDSLILQHYKNW
jgi:hypothetical protein